MKSTKLLSLRNAALGLTLGALPFAAHAAALVNGILTIKSGVRSYDPVTHAQLNVTIASYGMDNNGNLTVDGSEKVAIQSGAAGIVLGSAQAAGVSHSGAPLATDTNRIDAPWNYFGNTGMHYTSPGITVIGGNTANGLDFSGWTVSWNGLSIPMGTGAWNGYVNGIAQFNTAAGQYHQTGVCGDPYKLNYYATVPSGQFAGILYALHLEGFVFSGTCSGVVTTSPVDLAGAVDGLGATIAPAVIAANTTSISVTFNEPMVPASVTNAFMTVTGGATPVTVTGNPTASAGNTVFTFPVSGVAGGQTYTVTLNGVTPVAVSGNSYVTGPGYARTFTTFVDSTPPTVVSTTPANGATIAPNTGTITVVFSEPVTNVLAGAISINNGVTVGAPTGSNSNKTWTFPITSGNLTSSTTYTLSFNMGPQDSSGNPLILLAPQTFTTLANSISVLTPTTGDKLLICPGSKFGMEVSPGNPTWTSITGHSPITIGVVQSGGGTHGGAPNGSESLAIDNAWSFFGNTGLHYTAAPVTDNGNGTMNFSGWRMSWNGLASMNMGGGLPAAFSWDGVYGHSYTLTYLANVPPGDPSGFGGVLYTLNLMGKVNGGPSNVNAACDGTIMPSPSSNHSCGVKLDGSVACWGNNSSGQNSAPIGNTFTQVSAGANHSCVLRFDGGIICWGLNSAGQSAAPIP